MGWQDKARKKYETEKKVKDILKHPAVQQYMNERDAQSVANAIGRFAFILCGFLETRHGYKKEGFKKALAHLKTALECTTDDEEFFKTYDSYYKEEYGLDVLAELGLGLEEDKGKEQ